jgi:hypothetical protein
MIFDQFRYDYVHLPSFLFYTRIYQSAINFYFIFSVLEMVIYLGVHFYLELFSDFDYLFFCSSYLAVVSTSHLSKSLVVLELLMLCEYFSGCVLFVIGSSGLVDYSLTLNFIILLII